MQALNWPTSRALGIKPDVIVLLVAWVLCATPEFACRVQARAAPLVIVTELDYPPYSFLDEIRQNLETAEIAREV